MCPPWPGLPPFPLLVILGGEDSETPPDPLLDHHAVRPQQATSPFSRAIGEKRDHIEPSAHRASSSPSAGTPGAKDPSPALLSRMLRAPWEPRHGNAHQRAAGSAEGRAEARGGGSRSGRETVRGTETETPKPQLPPPPRWGPPGRPQPPGTGGRDRRRRRPGERRTRPPSPASRSRRPETPETPSGRRRRPGGGDGARGLRRTRGDKEPPPLARRLGCGVWARAGVSGPDPPPPLPPPLPLPGSPPRPTEETRFVLGAGRAR
ncbi:hypothetical protein H8959_018100 [Pygathrix nigripes]